MMIPMEERSRFSLYLSRVRSAGMPLAGEINIQRFDGTRKTVRLGHQVHQ